MFLDTTTFMNPAEATYHRPVLPIETVELLAPSPGRLFLDGTFGGGGHTRLFLEAGADVIALDQDPAALANGEELAREFSGRLTLVEGNFADAPAILDRLGVEGVDGVLLDIGVSSRQLDDPARGFSFRHDGPLDMRMGRRGKTAADLVATLTEEELTDIFRRFGEEPQARRISKRIIAERVAQPITSTGELAALVESVVGRHSGKHPATRVFQALRIAVNDELEVLERALDELSLRLNGGGRFGVISFHSLEDRMVKEFFRSHSREMLDDPTWPEPRPNPLHWFHSVTRKAVMPGAAECAENPRARSARLRVVERKCA